MFFGDANLKKNTKKMVGVINSVDLFPSFFWGGKSFQANVFVSIRIKLNDEICRSFLSSTKVCGVFCGKKMWMEVEEKGELDEWME